MEDALDRLPQEERACLLLREQGGLSVTQIAEMTGLDREQTHRALFSARERLRLESLERRSRGEEDEVREQVEGRQADRARSDWRSLVLPLLVILAIILLSPMLYDLALWAQDMLGAG